MTVGRSIGRALLVVAVAVLAAVSLVACTGPRVASLGSTTAARTVARGDEALEANRAAAPRVSTRAFEHRADFGSLFDAPTTVTNGSGEADVAPLFEVEGTAIHKRHVYDRMLEVDPQRVRDVEEALFLDVRIVELVRRFQIAAPQDEVDIAVRRDIARMERAHERMGDGVAFDQHVLESYGMPLEALRAHLAMLAWRRITRSYVIRYAARRQGVLLLERFLAKTAEEAEDARRAILEGGDFARIAEARSIGSRARFGGRLPPLPHGTDHPSASLAADVGVGEVGPVRATVLEDESPGFGFVRVVERREPLLRPFAELRAELRRELERRPVERAELVAFGAMPLP
mgnify:CR=1 FL=1